MQILSRGYVAALRLVACFLFLQKKRTYDLPDQAGVTVVNCSVNHSRSSETKDAELGVKSQSSTAAAVNTTVRYRTERRRWSTLERYLFVVCVVLLLTAVALAVIIIAFSFTRRTGPPPSPHPVA